MSVVVRMPEVATGAAEAAIQAWLVAVGDEVATGQPLVEIETEKAVVEYEAAFGDMSHHTYGATCAAHIAANGATITAVAAGALTGSLDALATTSSQVTLRANDYLSVTYTGGPPILKVYPFTR